jgi:hypothetical protein
MNLAHQIPSIEAMKALGLNGLALALTPALCRTSASHGEREHPFPRSANMGALDWRWFEGATREIPSRGILADGRSWRTATTGREARQGEIEAQLRRYSGLCGQPPWACGGFRAGCPKRPAGWRFHPRAMAASGSGSPGWYQGNQVIFIFENQDATGIESAGPSDEDDCPRDLCRSAPPRWRAGADRKLLAWIRQRGNIPVHDIARLASA